LNSSLSQGIENENIYKKLLHESEIDVPPIPIQCTDDNDSDSFFYQSVNVQPASLFIVNPLDAML
jgi:hypothetical protein